MMIDGRLPFKERQGSAKLVSFDVRRPISQRFRKLLIPILTNDTYTESLHMSFAEH